MLLSSFRASRRKFFYLLLSTLIIIILQLLAGIHGAHATTGTAHFDIKPSFFPGYEITPRSAFHYDSRPGAQIRDSIHVSNDGTARGTVTLYPVNAITAQVSGEGFPPHTGPRHDMGVWVTMSKQQVTLNPGQSQDISFTLRIPRHIRPGQHAGGLVAEEPVQLQSSLKGPYRTLVRLHTREVIGILVNLPGKLVENLAATGITYSKTKTYQNVQVGLKNTGTQILYPSGSLQILNATGQPLQNIPMKLDAILPQDAINYSVYMHRHALVPGTYQAILTLQYGHHHTLKYKTSFAIPFPPLAKSVLVPKEISDLVTPDENVFQTLTPWHYVIGIAFLFLLVSALFFWGRSAYKAMGILKKRLADRESRKR